MSKNTSQKKYCNCQISSDTKILKKEVNHSFCEKCGSIILKGANGTIYYTLKPKQKRLPYEFNPINIFQSMKKMSEEKYPNIKEDYKRISTEEYLENNLESQQTSNKEIKNKENVLKTDTDNKTDNFLNSEHSGYNNDTNEKYSDETDEQNQNIIFMKQIMPISYINKTRHKEVTINKLLPKKKRVFISKLINQNRDFDPKKIILPIVSKCLMTHQYLIQKEKKLFNPVINKYFFYTKLIIDKDEEKNYKLKKKKSFINKFPKIYKKTIVSPSKNSIFRTRTKIGRNSKYENIININSNGQSIDINFQKGRNRKEKISVISKDKDKEKDSYDLTNSQGEDNHNHNKFKGRNIIIRQNSNIIKELTEDMNGNHIDISIQFSNKDKKNILNTKKLIKKYPASANKRHIDLTKNLYKELNKINNKLDNKDEYLRKHLFSLDYQKHVGDELNCPICREVRKRGKQSEKEKGLFNAFSFRNYKTLNKRPLSRLKISFHKGKENELLYDLEKKRKNDDNNTFSMHNIDAEIKKKYLQFNGLNNRLNKLNRYGSNENLNSIMNDNDKKGYRNLKLNMDREIEKNGDGNERRKYPVLNNYFHE